MLTEEAVLKVSKLARLKLTKEELEVFSHQLTSALENFEIIQQIETSEIEPLITPTDFALNLRSDIAAENSRDELSQKILANAPESVGRLFKVPPVV